MATRKREANQRDAPVRVFISATSKDLGTVRELVKQALLTMGCMPVEQTNFPPDYRSVQDDSWNALTTVTLGETDPFRP
jgi:hypothetical protein